MSAEGLRVVLVRHGESKWNAAGRFQGQAGPGLTARGRSQAERTAARLAAELDDVTLVVRSDLDRVVETAAPIVRRLRTPELVDPRWRELDIGQWSGRTRDEVLRDEPEVLTAWLEGADMTPPGGESLAALSRRVMAALADLHAGGGTVVVVTHGGPIRAVLTNLGALGPQVPDRRSIDNCSVTVLARGSEGWDVRLVNDTGHLDDVPEELAG